MADRIITIEKTFGGWARTPQGSSSITLEASVETSEDQYAESTIISLFRFERYGDIAPGEMFQAMSGQTDLVNALPLNGGVASNSEAFVVLANSRLIRFGIGDDAIDGSFVIGTDVLTDNDNDMHIFQASDGSEWVAWTWEHNVDNTADVARIKSNGTAQDDDFFSTLTGSAKLTKGVPHKMWTGPDRIVYVCNGRYLASHDPAGSSGNTQAFDLGAGWIAVAGASYQNYNAIIARKGVTALAGFAASESLLMLWNGFSPTPDYVSVISDFEATGIKVHEGRLYIFSQGKNNITRIKTLLGNEVVTIFESGGIGNSPKHTAIDGYKGLVVWLQDSANFNMSALLPLGNGRYGHHEIMYPHLSTATISAVGMCKQLSGNFLYVGNTVAGVNNIVKINHNSYYPNAAFKTRLIKLPYRSNIKEVRVYFSQFGTGASITCSLFEGYNAMSVGGANDLLNRQLTRSGLGAIQEFIIPIFIPNISSFYMNFRFDHSSQTDTAVIIQRVEVVYEPILTKTA